MKSIYFSLCLFPILISHAIAFDLSITGNSKTSGQVIEREISDLRDMVASDSVVVEVKRRLWNLRMFSKVEVEITSSGGILISVDERWTTIPIAKFSSGGGTEYMAVGVYDINSFGENLELGAQYEQLNDSPAGVVWFRKPQFLGDRNLRIGADLWSINRIRELYTESGEDDGAFTVSRTKYQAFIDYKFFNDNLLIGARYDYNIDEVSDFGLSDEQIQRNNENIFMPKSKNTIIFHELYLELGQLNYQNHLVDGAKLELKAALVTKSDQAETNNTHSLRWSYFKILETTHNLAWQFKYQFTDLSDVQYQQYIGGLFEIRGYLDGQFRGNSYWQNNLEYRFDLFERGYLIVQGNIFTDQAKSGQNFNTIIEDDEEILLSSGLGVRLISPKVFRLVVRIDYAQTHTRDVERGLSFGIQQFF